MANNIVFKTALIKGAKGDTQDVGNVPTDGVIYYDGDDTPDGYEETTAPGGGGGSNVTITPSLQTGDTLAEYAIDGNTGYIKTYASNITPAQLSGDTVKIADFTINNHTGELYAPAGGANVSITPSYNSGDKIADYSIDGVSGALYIPNGGGYTRTTLATLATKLNSGTITLSDDLTNYDMLEFLIFNNYQGGYEYFYVPTENFATRFPNITLNSGLQTDVLRLQEGDNLYTKYCVGSQGTTELDYFNVSLYPMAVVGITFGSGGGGVTRDTLYSNSGTTADQTITLAHNLTDYDEVIIQAKNTGNAHVISNTYVAFTLNDIIGAETTSGKVWYGIDDYDSLILAENSGNYYIEKIIGVK
jgi:hypothetical protein